MRNSSKSKPRRKPKDDFPLSQHKGSGQWCKKVRGKVYYFGSVKLDPTGQNARKEYVHDLPYLERGETPPAIDLTKPLTLRELVNRFLAIQEARQGAGEISPRSYRDYYSTCERLIDHFGRDQLISELRPSHFMQFKLTRLTVTTSGKKSAPASVKGGIILVRGLFRFAFRNKLIDKPMEFGDYFNVPKAKQFNEHRREVGKKLFSRAEILQVLNAADVQLKAMTLLALNGGLGNSDVAALPQSAFGEPGWLDFPRVKTGIDRRIPLWPETTEAVKAAIEVRPRPADPTYSDRVFLTRCGVPWVRTQPRKKKDVAAEGNAERGATPDACVDSISMGFRKLLKKLGINGHRNFYCLRHTFQTEGDACRDFVAVRKIMGHSGGGDIADAYRERVSDERLRAVVESVRTWLYSSPMQEAKNEGGAA